jgi:hypothetical protein
MPHPLFKEYTAMDNIVQGLVKEIPVERGEIIYLMEMESQSAVFRTILILGLCGSALCILLTFL